MKKTHILSIIDSIKTINKVNDGHNVKTVQKLDKDIYIEYDEDDKRFYIASDYDRCQRPFSSIAEAEFYWRGDKKGLRAELVGDSVRDARIGYNVSAEELEKAPLWVVFNSSVGMYRTPKGTWSANSGQAEIFSNKNEAEKIASQTYNTKARIYNTSHFSTSGQKLHDELDDADIDDLIAEEYEAIADYEAALKEATSDRVKEQLTHIMEEEKEHVRELEELKSKQEPIGDGVSPMTYAKLKEKGYSHKDWENWSDEEKVKKSQEGKEKSGEKSSKKSREQLKKEVTEEVNKMHDEELLDAVIDEGIVDEEDVVDKDGIMYDDVDTHQLRKELIAARIEAEEIAEDYLGSLNQSKGSSGGEGSGKKSSKKAEEGSTSKKEEGSKESSEKIEGSDYTKGITTEGRHYVAAPDGFKYYFRNDEEVNSFIKHVLKLNSSENKEAHTFDPNKDNIEKGKSVILAEDVSYGDYDEFVDSLYDFDGLSEKEAKEKLARHGLKINEKNEVIIPKGTKMISKGKELSGWPTFEIEGLELDFAGEPFKIEDSTKDMKVQELLNREADHEKDMEAYKRRLQMQKHNRERSNARFLHKEQK